MNLNLNQILAISMAVLGVLGASTAQLTELFGGEIAKNIISLSSLSSAIMAAILAAITGQGSMVRGVAQMPGVEKITVNGQANQTLAQIAVADDQPKVEPLPSAETAVNQKANG